MTKLPTLLVLLLLSAAPAAADDAERLIASILKSKARAQEVPVAAARFPKLWVARDGKTAYAHRFRIEKDYTSYYDLARIDLRSGKLEVVGNTGTSQWGGRVRDGWVFGESVVDYGRQRLFKVARGKRVQAPFSRAEVEGYATSGADVIGHDDAVAFGLDGQRRVELFRFPGKHVSVREGAPQGGAVLLYDHRSDDNNDGKIDYRDQRTYVLVRYEAGFKNPRAQTIYTEPAGKRVGRVAFFPDGRLLLDVKEDTTGDGKPDDASRLWVFDPGTKKPIPAVPGRLTGLGWLLTVHPSGAILYATDTQVRGKSRLQLHLTTAGKKPRTIGRLPKGVLRSLSITPDWKTLVFTHVTDTDGDGKVYGWKDKGRIHRLQLRD